MYILLPLDEVPEAVAVPSEFFLVVVVEDVVEPTFDGGLNVLREPKVLPLWFLLPAVPLPLLLLLLLLLLMMCVVSTFAKQSLIWSFCSCDTSRGWANLRTFQR